MSYSAWQKVESGLAPGTVKGRLPLQRAASAFAYRKEIIVQVFLNGGSDSVFKDVRGQWKVRIRQSAAKNASGATIAPILLEQTVTWTARVYAFTLGGVALVTWQPLGDGGSGDQQTARVDGAECALVADVNAASEAELATYGERGAWRFLDGKGVRSGASARQKYDAERGFTLFTSEGAATVGGYHFFATWQSPYYRCALPPGAILETVFDGWQTGQLTTEAFYSFSSQAGNPTREAALFDARTGSHWRLFAPREGGTRIWRSRQVRPVLSARQVDFGPSALDGSGGGTLESTTCLGGLQLLRGGGGTLLALGAADSSLRLYASHNEGEHWKCMMNQPLDLTPLASCLDATGAHLTIYGRDATGAAAYARLAFGRLVDADGTRSNGWRIVESGAVSGAADVTLPTEGVGSLTACEGGVLRLAARTDADADADADASAMTLLLSRDGGKTYERESLT